jgi:hypothetical protein
VLTLGAWQSDINMPIMDGLELPRQIKTRRPDLPVMMVTAYGDDERRRLASEYGAAEFITKPVDFDLLKIQLRDLSDAADYAAPGRKRHVPCGAFSFTGDASRPPPLGGTSSGLAENALDLAGDYAIDLGDLGNRHAVFDPGADAREVRRRDRGRRMRLAANWSFELFVTGRRRRRDYS